MAQYTTNPVTELGVDENGTRLAEVANIGKKHHMATRGERLPAFALLAKSTGGFLAENEDGMDLDQAMLAARMNFRVEFQNNIEVIETLPDGVTKTRYPHRGTRAFWDGDPNPVGMGMVLSRYQIVQPRQTGELGQALMKNSGANVVAAGIHGSPLGSKTYLAFKLPGELTIGGSDKHGLYLTILNSYNGTTGLTGLFAPIRETCTNMVTITFGKVANRFTFRHSGNVDRKQEDALEALGVAQEWTAAWKRAAERLLAWKMSEEDLDNYLEKVLSAKESASSKVQAGVEGKRLMMKQIITTHDTCEFGRGTAYAALQGVQEWSDWFYPTQKKGTAGDIARCTRILNGTGNEGEKLKLHAASLLKI